MELAQGIRRGERGARAGRAARDGRDDLRHAERLGRLGREHVFGVRLVIGVLRGLAGEEIHHVHPAEIVVRVQVNEQRVDGDGDVFLRRPFVEPLAELAEEGPHALDLEIGELRRQRQLAELLLVDGGVRHAVPFQVLAVIERGDVGDAERAQFAGRAARLQPVPEARPARLAETDGCVEDPTCVHGPVIHVQHVHAGVHVALCGVEEQLAEGGVIAAAGEGLRAERHHPVWRILVAVQVLVPARRIAARGTFRRRVLLALQAVERALVADAHALDLLDEALRAIDPQALRHVERLHDRRRFPRFCQRTENGMSDRFNWNRWVCAGGRARSNTCGARGFAEATSASKISRTAFSSSAVPKTRTRSSQPLNGRMPPSVPSTSSPRAAALCSRRGFSANIANGCPRPPTKARTLSDPTTTAVKRQCPPTSPASCR